MSNESSVQSSKFNAMFVPCSNEQKDTYNVKNLQKTSQAFFLAAAQQIYALEELSVDTIVEILNGTFKSTFFPEKVPKKPSKEQGPSSYILYFTANRAAIQAANPDANVTQIGKICGAQWNALSDTEKQKYADESNKIKEQIAAGTYVKPAKPASSTKADASKKRKADVSPPKESSKKAATAATATASTPAVVASPAPAASTSKKGKK